MERQTLLVTGASSGFGQMAAYALADAEHTVYASMLDLAGRNADKAQQARDYANAKNVDVRTVELDVQDQASVDAAVAAILQDAGRIDGVVHNAGHMVFGPTESFTPEQLAEMYDVNVLGTQRLNRAVLPHLRAQGRGLLVWVGSSSVAGGVPPLLGPYFAAKAGMDALAVCYARELAPWGIETTIIVPGAFTKGTNHFPNAGKPKDEARLNEYEAHLGEGYADRIKEALAATVPDDADPAAVARAIVEVVDAPFGRRPFRVHIDPAEDGAAVSYAVIDRVREEFLRRIGEEGLLHPTLRP